MVNSAILLARLRKILTNDTTTFSRIPNYVVTRIEPKLISAPVEIQLAESASSWDAMPGGLRLRACQFQCGIFLKSHLDSIKMEQDTLLQQTGSLFDYETKLEALLNQQFLRGPGPNYAAGLDLPLRIVGSAPLSSSFQEGLFGKILTFQGGMYV